MSYRPLISVCMPVYNGEPYLAEAIQGVLTQTYDNLELVVCDNDSTDGSAQIAGGFSSDPRVRFVANRWNLGFAGNLQKATSLARGDLLIVHCADDVMLPNAMETYVETIEQSECDAENLVLMSDTYMMDAAGESFVVLGKSPDGFKYDHRSLGNHPQGDRVMRFSGHEILRSILVDMRLFGWLGSIMFSRSLLTQTEGYEGGKWISPDKEFMYKVFALDPPVLYLQEPLFRYRFHESNQLGTERRQGVLKVAVDEYEYTFQYPDSFLAKFGSSSARLRQTFIDNQCLRKALHELAVGSWTLALRHVAFGLATYPGIALKNPKLYLALAGLLTGPVGRLPARAGLAVRRMYRPSQSTEVG